MPKRPVTGRPGGKTKTRKKFNSDDSGGGARGKGAEIAGGGEGLKPIKLEPVEDVGINAEFRGGRRRTLAATPLRSENLISPPLRGGQAKAELIVISDDDDDRSPAGSRPRKVLLTKGSDYGKKRVKQKPSSGSGSLTRSAGGTGSVVGDPATGSSTAKRKRGRPKKVVKEGGPAPGSSIAKRKRGRPKKEVKEGGPVPGSSIPKRKRGRPKKAVKEGDPVPGSSIAKRKRGRPKKEVTEEARSSSDNNNGRNRGAGRESEVDKSLLAKEALVGAPGKKRRDMKSGERSSGAPPVDATIGSRTRSRAPQRGRMRYAYSHPVPQLSDDSEDDGVAGEQHGRVKDASFSAWVTGEDGREEQQRVLFDDLNNDAEADEEQQQRVVVFDGFSSDTGADEEQQQRVVVFDGFNSDTGADEEQQQRVVVFDGFSSDTGADEEQQEQERDEMVEEVAMEVDGEGSEGDSGDEGEQEEYLVRLKEESDNGDSQGQEDQAAIATANDDVEEQQEREWNNELEEEESGSEEDRHSNCEGDGEEQSGEDGGNGNGEEEPGEDDGDGEEEPGEDGGDGEEESGEDDGDAEEESENDDGGGEEESGDEDWEVHGAREAHSGAPSNALAAGCARSDTYMRKMFEGLYFLEKPDNTPGKGVASRTRSKRNCSDVKLLKRGSFSKPVKIDISDSSSESKEEILPLNPMALGLPSSSDYHSNGTSRRSSMSRKRKASTSPDECEVRKYRRLKKGLSNEQAANNDSGKNGQAAMEGDDIHSGPVNNEHDDLSFKQHVNIAKTRKHRSSSAKAAYDELLNAMFAEWGNYTMGSIPADRQNDNTMPLTFSFGDEDEEDKSDDDKFQKDLWGDFDSAIESINVEEDDTCSRQKVPPEEAGPCKNGRHTFIIDEQIGVRCKHCNFVDLEIRYVHPSMGKFATERDSTSPKLDSFKKMLTVLEENDLLISNGSEGTSRIGARKAGSVWDLIPGIKEGMFLHQQDAFEFMWRKLAGSTEIEEIEELRCAADTDTGGGCVISHAPGTGKTRLAITFVQSYLEVFPNCCPVIIAPRAMLATWEQEFKKWNVKLPFHVLNSNEINCSDDKTIQEKIEKDRSFARRLLANKMDQNYRRLVKLASWVNGTSIIGVSYTLFRKLANDDGIDGDHVKKLLLERPDLLVLDEGHTPRNKASLIWKVLSRVRTGKRIILSGTLFQNTFEELYNTLYLVRPNNQDDAMLLEKDGGRDWTSLRLSNITEENIYNVRAKLEPFVHYHKGNFLEKSLPGLKETVVILNPLPRQKEIIESIEKTAAMGALDAEYKLSLALVHPSLITCAKLSEKEACLVDHTLLDSLRSNPCEGVKTRFVVEVIHQCEALNERVLVFSQYLEPLSLIMDQLKRRFNWTEDKEILHMSGNVQGKQREAMMVAFNDMKSKAKVMLASTKSCCEGITLVGASRVVLLDVVWNPSVGRQAIGRAYRIGQKKVVYTYNLIADGTKEMEKYSRQVKKDHMSKRLFSNEELPEGGNISPESTFNDRVLEAMTAREDLKDLFVQIRIENQTDGSTRDVLET